MQKQLMLLKYVFCTSMPRILAGGRSPHKSGEAEVVDYARVDSKEDDQAACLGTPLSVSCRKACFVAHMKDMQSIAG